MNYFEIVNKAIELTIETVTETNQSYLEPRYKEILREADVHLPDLPDEELYEILKLEVEKRNAINDRLYPVVDWLYKILTTTIEPELTADETELMKDVLAYLDEKKKQKQ